MFFKEDEAEQKRCCVDPKFQCVGNKCAAWIWNIGYPDLGQCGRCVKLSDEDEEYMITSERKELESS